MDDKQDQRDRSTNNDETAAQRLRRILSSAKENGGGESSRKNATQPAPVPPQPSEREHTLDQDSSVDSSLPDEDETINGKALEDTEPVPVLAEEQVSRSEFDSTWHSIVNFLDKLQEKLKRNLSKKKPVNGRRKTGFFDRFSGKPGGCILAGLIGSLFLVIALGILAISFLIFQYFTIAADLPSVSDLRQYASQFETTRIYDRNGNLIYEILDPNAGRRTYTKLDNISPYLIAATIATEDKDFYTNPGFDPWGIMRALWQNYTSGQVVSGASTITQQLARTLLLSPEERSQVTTQRKAREIVLAAEITRKYSKDEILELYLNEIYYGSLAYGIEAAAETYFNTTAGQLDLAQASFLAGLPQAPAVYDVFSSRAAALLRHVDVLNLMYQLSRERECIRVNQSNVPICVTLEEAVAAAQEIDQYAFTQRGVNMLFPHWVNYIRAKLEQQYDPQTIYRSGFNVYTTLDPDFQNYAQQTLTEQVNALADKHATDGALVAIRPSTGEILAMVGSADFNNEAISGQVNMAVAPRQPGSSIKPLTYTAAFEKGWTPATLIWDVPSEFPPSGDPDDTRDPYKPVNYDGKFHGPVLARTALASSYNVPAVKTLSYVGIYDDPDTNEKEGFLAFAQRMGITTLTRDDYGLSLTLGGGDVSLLELTNAYAIFANAGKRVTPYAIERIEDSNGSLIYQYTAVADEQVIRSDHAYLVTSILSDNDARTPAFGANSVLKLPFTAAVKTGTTNDFRDNWTLGYTPDFAIGVWVGNADYTPMENISGVSGAAPLWANVMQWAVDHYLSGNPGRFIQPDSIEEYVVCKASGAEPSDACPDQTAEIFAQGQPPLDEDDDLWKEVEVDTWTNLKAGSACSEFTEEKLTLNVSDKWAKKWLKEDEDGKAWVDKMGFKEPLIFTPERECKADDPRPSIVFVGLSEDARVTTPSLEIYAVVTASDNFKQFKLQYGVGNNPGKWKTLVTGKKQYKQPEQLISWDVYEADATRITLRIYLESSKGTYAEKRIHLNLLVPTLTPTVTEQPAETQVPTEIIYPTETPTPENTSTPADTPIPTEIITFLP